MPSPPQTPCSLQYYEHQKSLFPEAGCIVSLALYNRTKFCAREVRAPRLALNPRDESKINLERGSASLESSSVGPGSLLAWQADFQMSSEKKENVVVTCQHLGKEAASISYSADFLSAGCKKNLTAAEVKSHVKHFQFSLPTYENQTQAEPGLLVFCHSAHQLLL